MTIRTVVLVLAVTAGLTGSALQSRAADLTKAEGGRYAIDKRHTKIVFAINHRGFSTY